MPDKRIAIIGGGISGLTAAYHLAQARRGGAPVDEHLHEAGPRLGGVIRSEEVDGCLIEAGPDAFLTEKQDGIELCEQLGLVSELIGSEDHQRRTWVLHRGRLVPLPEGFEFMVPTRPLGVLRTPLLSWRDKLALATELFSRPPRFAADESVASFVERHFSRGLLENIVEPLLAAVYGGDAHRLSAQSVLPRLVQVERQSGSLVRGLRRRKPVAPEQAPRKLPAPLFTALRHGLETLVRALQMNLDAQRITCNSTVEGVTPRASGGYDLHFAGGATVPAEAVILAVPARVAAHLLRETDIVLVRELQDIHYSSSIIVAVVYETDKVPELPLGFGFLVPRKEGMRIRACSWPGQKFPGRVPPGRVLLRCFLGGMQDEGVLALSDEDTLRTVRAELGAILGIDAEPLLTRVYRWPKAMAQYTVGHERRLKEIQLRLSHHPGLYLAGNAYQGIGIPDCVRSGRQAAEQCLLALRALKAASLA